MGVLAVVTWGVVVAAEAIPMHSRLQPDDLAQIADAIEGAVGHDGNSRIQPTVLRGTR
jgi:hypothetical protein